MKACNTSSASVAQQRRMQLSSCLLNKLVLPALYPAQAQSCLAHVQSCRHHMHLTQRTLCQHRSLLPAQQAQSAPTEPGRVVGTAQQSAPGLKPEAWLGSESQLQALEQLRARLSSLRPGKVMPDDETLKWYLRDRYFDVTEAEEKLTTMLTWKDSFQPGSITGAQVAREMASGKAYVHSTPDVYGRPVIVIRVKRHVTGEYPITDSKRLAVHLIDQALAALPQDGEQIVGVFDLRDFDFGRNADFGFAKFMVEAFFEYYPRRVAQVLFVDAPWVFYPAWEVIKPAMRKYAALVRFLSARELAKEFFTPSTVPADFKS